MHLHLHFNWHTPGMWRSFTACFIYLVLAGDVKDSGVCCSLQASHQQCKIIWKYSKGPKVQLELPAKAVRWVCHRLFSPLELGNGKGRLPAILAEFTDKFTNIKSGVIPPKQKLQACTAAVLRVKSTWSLWLPAQFMCIPAAAFGSAEGAEPVGDSDRGEPGAGATFAVPLMWNVSVWSRCRGQHCLLLCQPWPRFSCPSTDVLEMLLAPVGKVFLVCTSRILLVLVRKDVLPAWQLWNIAKELALCKSLCAVFCLCGTLSIHCIKALWSINLVLCH